MRKVIVLVCLFVSIITFSGVFVHAQEGDAQGLDMYVATVSHPQVAQLQREGYDIAAVRNVASGAEVDLVLSPGERRKLLSQGITLRLWRNREGVPASQLADAQLQNGFTVWRPFDGPDGFRAQMDTIASSYPDLVKLKVFGQTHQGREMVALKVTQNAQTVEDGSRPAVLYFSLQHAREWIGGEVNRRLMLYLLENYATNSDIQALLDSTEIWFVLVMNPDGYQYTFDNQRLWRKNLRDNNGDGQITNVDGVDPNRNWPEHWNYDTEGSSGLQSSTEYRGPTPGSEPEVQAMQQLMEDIGFTFMIDYHSYGPLILYPIGWQTQTPSVDDAIYTALAGTDASPAIPGYDPGVAADLYITNGDSTDYAYTNHDILSFTVELGEGGEGNGFVFPDDEALIQSEFEINLPFALDLAKSAATPTQPVSHLGNTVAPFYLDPFEVSYGDPQPVQVRALRSLGDITLNYQINGGAVQTAATEEWDGGERWGGNGVYYKTVRGVVTGTQPGDTVTVFFSGGGVTSDSFTYLATIESDAPVLILAAEDYSGLSPAQEPGPHYLDYYTEALDAVGLTADVYDIDEQERLAPHPLGVLSHYDAVIWYTGDDVITREPGMFPGTASRLANDTMLAVRSYLNEGGKLLYTGKYAGLQYAQGYPYDPVENAPCDGDDEAVNARCIPLSDDFLQYYLGAYIYNDDLGTTFDEEGEPTGLYAVEGAADPFNGLKWTFNYASADNQDHSASFIATSGILPSATYPQFTSAAAGKYGRTAFAPHTGNNYIYSQQADISYKRLTRTIDLTGQTSGELSFWISHDIEPDWDFFFVEAHTVGQDNWTTLPDQNGNTDTETGESCLSGWRELHPSLDNYQTYTPAGEGSEPTCTPTGTTGTWNAATGNSSGWAQWKIDLSAYAGQQVEVSLTYASDWGTQGLGVFLDDITISTGETTSFEEDLGGWTVAGPPPGSGENVNDFTRLTGADFPEGAVIVTPDTIYLGFGFEGISKPVQRNLVMQRTMAYLLGADQVTALEIPLYLPVVAR